MREPSRKRPYRKPRETAEADAPVQLYGLHTVEAALRNPGRVRHRLLATANAAARLAERFAGRLPLEPEIVRPRALDALVGGDAVHQGVVLVAEKLAASGIDAARAAPLVVVLDQVTDPHNVGAILRSAAALGAGAVILTARHGAAETAVMAKSASGALDLVPLVRVGDLAAALADLKAVGFMVVGLDEAADARLDGLRLAAPLALILGAEGRGLRPRTRRACSALARIPLAGTLASLNVSNAAALGLFIAATALGFPGPAVAGTPGPG